MDKNRPQKTDEDIVREFDRLFEEMPEPNTDEEIKDYLIGAGYDPEELKKKGLEFVENLMVNNWRFVSSEEIDEAASKVNKIPLREDWGRERLLQAIRQASSALAYGGRKPELAFRNLDSLTDKDLASMLQELEHEANEKGIKLDFINDHDELR